MTTVSLTKDNDVVRYCRHTARLSTPGRRSQCTVWKKSAAVVVMGMMIVCGSGDGGGDVHWHPFTGVHAWSSHRCVTSTSTVCARSTTAATTTWQHTAVPRSLSLRHSNGNSNHDGNSNHSSNNNSHSGGGGGASDGTPDHTAANGEDLRSSYDLPSSSTGAQRRTPEDIEAVVRRKIRLQKAQSDIDRILAGPNPPFDAETELKKVVRLAPLPSSSSSSLSSETTNIKDEVDAHHAHADLQRIEDNLYDAVSNQDYGLAAQHKRDLDRAHVDDSLAVLQVNAAFYRAFSRADSAAMARIWLHDETATCIHPSHPPLCGAATILNTYSQMFQSTTTSQSSRGTSSSNDHHPTNRSGARHWMEPHNIRVSCKIGGVCLVTCDEHVYVRRFVRGQQRQTERVNTLLATNVFRKVRDRWCLVYHHASWHPDSAAAQQALRYATGSGKSESRSTSQANHKGLTSGNDNKNIGMDGILGLQNFGPLLGNDDDDDDSKSSSQSPPNGRRIVMGGSLSDILNGNLEDLLGGSAGSSNKNNDDDENSNAIIQFHSIEEMDDDDDDDNDDEGDDDDYELETLDGEPLSAMANKLKETKATNRRQSCISALRTLAASGSISPQQKRVLLTDIVQHSAEATRTKNRDTQSLVEVAYELLYSGDAPADGDDDDMAQEDFADQCRVLADTLLADAGLARRPPHS